MSKRFVVDVKRLEEIRDKIHKELDGILDNLSFDIRRVKEEIDSLFKILIDLSENVGPEYEPRDTRPGFEPGDGNAESESQDKSGWEDLPATEKQISLIVKLRTELGEEVPWSEVQRLKKASDQGLLTRKKASDWIEDLIGKLREKKKGGGNGNG